MTSLPQRALGTSGLVVSAMGLGCMGMSVFYGSGNDDALSIKTIQHAMDLGVTLFDTAELYGNGHNEELLGKAVKGRRDSVILAAKFGLRLIEGGGRQISAYCPHQRLHRGTVGHRLGPRPGRYHCADSRHTEDRAPGRKPRRIKCCFDGR